MYRIILKTTVVIFGLAMHAHAFAFGEPITTTITIDQPSTNIKQTAAPLKKEVILINLQLSDATKAAIGRNFANRSKLSASISFAAADNALPAKINLGMHDVPVLDQGRHGACVTFAAIAAIDAILGKGDYISALCSLELGSYLEERGYMSSGWQGSLGPWVLDQIVRFGIVNHQNQVTRSCANVTQYPTEDHTTGAPMPLDEFRTMSENLNSKFYYVPHMNYFQRIDTGLSDIAQAASTLNQIKRALANGNRLILGAVLVLAPNCDAGACATYHKTKDTWAITKDLDLLYDDLAGHELVISGYDDNAIAVDSSGVKHKGLLTLRNSWSDAAGDHGNYYMTYDYFVQFSHEVNEIVA